MAISHLIVLVYVCVVACYSDSLQNNDGRLPAIPEKRFAPGNSQERETKRELGFKGLERRYQMNSMNDFQVPQKRYPMSPKNDFQVPERRYPMRSNNDFQVPKRRNQMNFNNDFQMPESRYPMSSNDDFQVLGRRYPLRNALPQRRDNFDSEHMPYYKRMLPVRTVLGRKETFTNTRRELFTFCQPQLTYSNICCPKAYENVGPKLASPIHVNVHMCERQGVDGNCEVSIVTKTFLSDYEVSQSGQDCSSFQNYHVTTMDL